MIPTLAETYKIVDATAGPVTTNGTVTSTYVSVANAHVVELVLNFNQAVSFASVITLNEAKTVAGGSVQAITGNADFWANGATGTNDTLVKKTAGLTYTLATGTTPQLIIVRFMVALLDAGFSYVNFTIATSSQATNFVAGNWFLFDAFQQATPPTAVV